MRTFVDNSRLDPIRSVVCCVIVPYLRPLLVLQRKRDKLETRLKWLKSLPAQSADCPTMGIAVSCNCRMHR